MTISYTWKVNNLEHDVADEQARIDAAVAAALDTQLVKTTYPKEVTNG